MLPQTLRLDLRIYPEFFEQAKSVRSRNFTLLYSPLSSSVDSAEELSMRLAITVSKRLARGVDRVKIKRHIRHLLIDVFRQSPTLFQRPYAVVVIPKTLIPPKGFAQYEKELEELLSKVPPSNFKGGTL